MTRRRVWCVCGAVSEPEPEPVLRRQGWRVVPAMAADAALAGEVFVWACPSCAAARNVQQRAS